MIDQAPDSPLDTAESPRSPMPSADPDNRAEPSPLPPRRRSLRHTALAVLSFTGKAAMIAAAAILFLIVLAFMIDDPDPVRTPSQSASMRY